MITTEDWEFFPANILRIKVSLFFIWAYKPAQYVINLDLVAIVLIHGNLNIYPLIVRHKNLPRYILIENLFVLKENGKLIRLRLVYHEAIIKFYEVAGVRGIKWVHLWTAVRSNKYPHVHRVLPASSFRYPTEIYANRLYLNTRAIELMIKLDLW